MITTLVRLATDNRHYLNFFLPGALHSIIIYPQSTQDVVKIVKIATKYRIPVVPYAGATSLEGHTRGHPTAGGICIDMSNMDKVLEIHRVYNSVIRRRMRQAHLVPSRRLGPRMSIRCAVDGHQRDVERKRSVECQMITYRKT